MKEFKKITAGREYYSKRVNQNIVVIEKRLDVMDCNDERLYIIKKSGTDVYSACFYEDDNEFIRFQELEMKETFMDKFKKYFSDVDIENNTFKGWDVNNITQVAKKGKLFYIDRGDSFSVIQGIDKHYNYVTSEYSDKTSVRAIFFENE